MTHGDVMALFLALGVLLGVAKLLGEISRRLNQPSVIGELLAGIVLGPTLLGTVSPEAFKAIFPSLPGFSLAMEGITKIAITLFLLVAGIEVNLSTVIRQGKPAVAVSLGGTFIPFLIGFALGWVGPTLTSGEAFGQGDGSSPLIFALFLATALSISALPVIAKILMDLNLYRSELGMTVIAAAVLSDLAGWMVFAVLLGNMSGTEVGSGNILMTVVLTLTYAAVMLSGGRLLIHRSLPFLQANSSGSGGVLSLAVILAFLGAALTEWIGIHAIFGAFIVGVALGDSSHFNVKTKQALGSFVTAIFAPLFFATVGLKVNFLENFDLPLVLLVTVIACVGKFIGCVPAARWAGLPRRDSWAIGAALNARGAMEIILALVALEAGLIEERLFVALVVMALVTSVIAGPVMQRVLNREKLDQPAEPSVVEQA